MSAEASVVSCPRCGSTVRRGSDWCTLCFADLRPVPPPRVSPDPPMVPPPASPALAAALLGTPMGLDTLAGSPDGLAEPPVMSGGRDALIPCRTCGEPVSLAAGVCAACGTGIFDTLKEEAASFTVPVLGDVMKFGKGARAGLAFGFAVVFVAVLFLLVTAVGHFV